MIKLVLGIFQTRRLLIVVVALGLFVLAANNVTDPDVGWHLRSGQLMLQTHEVPHTDPYSFTRAGHPWVDHEWLSQIIIFGAYRLCGWGGLIVGFAAVIASALWLVFARCPGPRYVAGAITIWGALASSVSWGARPQMFTFLLASLFLLILERSYQKPKLLFWLPPLLLLWVNLHGGYLLGVVFLVLFLLSDLIDVASGIQGWTAVRARCGWMLLAIAICLIIVPLNPNGVRMYWYPLETLRSRAAAGYIKEWLSPNFHEPRYLATLLMMLTTMAVAPLSSRRSHARELLLLLATMFAALHSGRHIPIYVLVAVPILAGSVQPCFEARRFAPRRELAPISTSRLKLFANAALLATLVTFLALRIRYVVAQQPRVEARAFPAEAATFITKERPPAPIFNYYNWGGYFIWRLYPLYKVYFDGRADLYGDSFMDAFATTYYLRGKGWQQPLEEWEIRTVIMPPDAPVVTALQSVLGWKLVFSDAQAVILTRPNSPSMP